MYSTSKKILPVVDVGFPRRGGDPIPELEPTSIEIFVAENCMKMKEIGLGDIPGPPPPGSANSYIH